MDRQIRKAANWVGTQGINKDFGVHPKPDQMDNAKSHHVGDLVCTKESDLKSQSYLFVTFFPLIYSVGKIMHTPKVLIYLAPHTCKSTSGIIFYTIK